MVLDRPFSTILPGEEAGEDSSRGITQLPANILEAFIPGYGVISQFLFEVLGFDITIAVSVCFLIFGLATSIRYLWLHASEFFKTYFMSSISIESDDDVYEQVMDWLGDQKVSRESLGLIARTGKHSWDIDDEGACGDNSLSQGKWLNFSNWESKIPPKFQPCFGRHKFWYKGRYFELGREMKPALVSIRWSGMRAEEILRLSCVGRSTQPIKNLIMECQSRYFNKRSSRTTVRRPATKEIRSYGRNPWAKVAERPSRPMNTIVLEYEQKEHVLADINEYLRPATRRWYTNRGIPYRRGYLLHGPPGTGKTSLSFAIAGLFGLDIYCISLLEPTLTEEDLGLLFNNLPSRCVVLLEDIDSAGLIRSNESKADAADTEPIKTDVATEIAKAFETNAKNKNKTQGISLSGLLNTIDGVASHEGRVLVMTTNYPEKLDKALIRPGRIDVKVGFTLASQKQARELFTRIYSADRLNEAAVKLANNTITPSAASNEKPGEEVNVDEIARQFAEKIPADTFTPAAIQGFLLMHKKNPHGALEKVAEWKKSQAKSS